MSSEVKGYYYLREVLVPNGLKTQKKEVLIHIK